MGKRQFLIVTDDLSIGQSIQHHFENDQTTKIHCASSLSQALDRMIKDSYSLLIIDLQLFGMNRMEMVRILRIAKQIPILALTEPLDADEIITLFHAGIDAFLEKPIHVGVCSAQANALVELYLKSDYDLSKEMPITFGTIMMILPRYRQVFVNGELLELTRKEFDLLHFFARRPQWVFSREQLFTHVWDYYFELGGDDTVKVHVNTLRRKLMVLGYNPIENVRGVGYRFIPPGSVP